MKILITGFSPFGGEALNPALEAVKALPDTLREAQIHKLEVPVVFGKAIPAVVEEIRRLSPQAVICVGQAGGAAAITVERVALNLDDATSPDNEGNCPKDRPIDPGGAAAYFTTLPIREIVRAIRAAGLPAVISNSAGTYVCNHLFYGLMSFARHETLRIPAGFIHVPYIPAQVSRMDKVQPSMALADIVTALQIAIEETARRIRMGED